MVSEPWGGLARVAVAGGARGDPMFAWPILRTYFCHLDRACEAQPHV